MMVVVFPVPGGPSMRTIPLSPGRVSAVATSIWYLLSCLERVANKDSVREESKTYVWDVGVV